MQQYYFEHDLEDDIQILKVHKLYKYLSKVVAVKKGEFLILFNEMDKKSYQIIKITNLEINLAVHEVIPIKKDFYEIDLGIGLLKKDKIEWVIQKSTELAIKNINLLQLDNNVVKIDEDRKMLKLNRYKEIIISAVSQSKGNFLPSVQFKKINEIDYKNYDLIFLAHEKSEHMNSIVDKFKNLQANYPFKFLILIGPEGGFSDNEVNFFVSKPNVELISLGHNILRAETAAIYSISVIKELLREKENL